MNHLTVSLTNSLVRLSIVRMEKSLWLFIITIDSCIYMAYVLNVYRCIHYLFVVVYARRNSILIQLFSVHSITMVCFSTYFCLSFILIQCYFVFFFVNLSDLFAAFPCCQARLSCSKCFQPIVSIKEGLSNFSNYSLEFDCGHCGTKTQHFVKPFEEIFEKHL